MGGQADQCRGSWPRGYPGGGWDASPGLSAPSLRPPCLPGPHLEPPQEWQCLGHQGGRRPSSLPNSEPPGETRPREGKHATGPTQDHVLSEGGQHLAPRVPITPLSCSRASGCFCTHGLRIPRPCPGDLSFRTAHRVAQCAREMADWVRIPALCSRRQVSEHL